MIHAFAGAHSGVTVIATYDHPVFYRSGLDRTGSPRHGFSHISSPYRGLRLYRLSDSAWLADGHLSVCDDGAADDISATSYAGIARPIVAEDAVVTDRENASGVVRTQEYDLPYTRWD